jgi:hypothetical protein
MLSENVLADLTRRSPSQSMLVTAAWPSLSTESRLQVIAAVQGDDWPRNTPDWLLDLAMTDSAEIVRYWAARVAWFREDCPLELSTETEHGFRRLPAAPEDLKRAQAARNDPSDLVRFSVERLGYLSDADPLMAMPQQQRLIAIRNQETPSFVSFIDWLGKAIEGHVSDDDLAQCAEEFFALPSMIAEMAEDDFEDGMDAHVNGKAMTDGWALLKGKAGPQVARTLVYVLPVKRGLGRMKAEDLAAMPAQVLQSILFRRLDDHNDTFAELTDLIRKQPERFPPQVVEQLERQDEMYFSRPNPGEREERARRHAVDRQAAALDTALEIRREVQRLHERLNEVEAVASRKRGFFG